MPQQQKTKTPIKSNARKLKQKGEMGGKMTPPTQSLTHSHAHTKPPLCSLQSVQLPSLNF